MSNTLKTLQSLVPISQFNKGKAAQIFDRLNSQDELIVLKNNKATAIILTPKEYERLLDIEENFSLFLEAVRRIENNKGTPAIPIEEVMSELGISEEDIEAAEDLEIE